MSIQRAININGVFSFTRKTAIKVIKKAYTLEYVDLFACFTKCNNSLKFDHKCDMLSPKYHQEKNLFHGPDNKKEPVFQFQPYKIL